MIVFQIVSIVAILSGGVISAFTARRASRATAWLSAYLVLVVGLIQLGLISCWHRLGQPEVTLVMWALAVNNLGNAGIIVGTLLKKRYRVLVNLGGPCIALAMVLLLVAVRHASASWASLEFIGLIIVILVSAPIGLLLSARRRHVRTA